MSNNLMPEIMKMLGVEYGEKFQLDPYGTESAKGNLFYFNENNGLLMVYPDGVSCDANGLVYGILCGYYKIVKLSWEPKERDVYWTITFYSKGQPFVEDFVWYGDIFDCAKKALGMVYRTKEEAEAHMAEDYERLTGRWRGRKWLKT